MHLRKALRQLHQPTQMVKLKTYPLPLPLPPKSTDPKSTDQKSRKNRWIMTYKLTKTTKVLLNLCVEFLMTHFSLT